MKYTLEIDCGNAAFGDDLGVAGSEAARILRNLADDLDRAGIGETTRQPYDINGNRVGKATVTGIKKWQRERRRSDD